MLLLNLSYIVLTIVTLLILITVAHRTIKLSYPTIQQRTKMMQVILGLLFWMAYTYTLTLTGVLKDYSFPPKFVLFMILPAFVFTGIFLFKNKHQKWIINIPLHHLAFYQSFRILIESIFVWSVSLGILHKNVTIEGYNMDMIFAYTAPVMGYLLFKNKAKFRWIFKIWNYVGLLVIASIIVVFISTIYFPHFYGLETDAMPLTFAEYPYVLVAGFLMPSAVFIHVVSLIQLKQINQK